MNNRFNEPNWVEDEIKLSSDHFVTPDLIEAILYTMNRVRVVSPETSPKKDMVILVAPGHVDHIHIKVPSGGLAYVMPQPEIDQLHLPTEESEDTLFHRLKVSENPFEKALDQGMRKVLLCGGLSTSVSDLILSMPIPMDMSDWDCTLESRKRHDRGGTISKGGKVGFPIRTKCTNQYKGRGRNR
jgi:hypothetical protein